MAKFSISLLVLLLFIFYVMGSAEPTYTRTSRSWSFIKASCRTTRYQDLCVRCLSNYANATNATLMSPHEMAQISLTVSLVRARLTRAYILEVAHKINGTKGRDGQALKDCLNQITDSVEWLSQSVRELKHMAQAEGDDFILRTSNFETWVTAAHTDASMCLDEFSGRAMGGKTKATIKAKVLNVIQVTSNALTLFHRFAARHRAAGLTKTP